jgi:hypothetical protein
MQAISQFQLYYGQEIPCKSWPSWIHLLKKTIYQANLQEASTRVGALISELDDESMATYNLLR